MTALDAQSLLEEQIDRCGVPGAVVGLLTPGRTEAWAAGVLGLRTGVPATVDSIFKVGSITKVYTATLVASLAAQGRIALDRPVSEQLPGLRLSDPATTAAVTPRHLLNHTSGIDGDFYADTGRGDDALPRYVELLQTVPQIHAVGETLSYCNAGFNLLGHLAAHVTDATWEQALDDVVLHPAGLASTVTLAEDALLHRVAVGHHGQGDQLRQTSVWAVPRGSGPSANVAATIGDVLGFARLHLPSDGVGVLDEAAREMRREQVAVPAVGMGVHSWGLGWWRTTWDRTPVLGHDGASSGQRAYLRVLPTAGVAVAVLTNGGRANALAGELTERLVQRSVGIEVPRSTVPTELDPDGAVDDLVGSYRRDSEVVDIRPGAGATLQMTVRWVGPLLDGEEDDDLTERLVLRPVRREVTPDRRVLVAHPEDADPTAGPGEPITVMTLAGGRTALHFRMRLTPRLDA